MPRWGMAKSPSVACWGTGPSGPRSTPASVAVARGIVQMRRGLAMNDWPLGARPRIRSRPAPRAKPAKRDITSRTSEFRQSGSGMSLPIPFMTRVAGVDNGMGRLMPEPLWRNSLVLDIMSRFAGFALGTGRLRMRGRAPNGQSFIANPRLIWTIPRATATLAGVDLGPLGPVPQQATLGDFAIPQRGILAVGLAFFEPFDENRHLAVASRETA